MVLAGVPLSPRARTCVELAPFVIVLGVLSVEAHGQQDIVWVPLGLTVPWLSGLVAPALVTAGVVLALARRTPRKILHLWRIPCLLAPFGLLYPWAIVPVQHFGTGYAELPTFLAYIETNRWLRWRVLAGLGALLGTGAMPVGFALLLRWRPARWPVRVLALIVCLIPFAAVAVFLDPGLLLYTLVLRFPPMLGGPVVRLMACAALIVGAVVGGPERSARTPSPSSPSTPRI